MAYQPWRHYQAYTLPMIASTTSYQSRKQQGHAQLSVLICLRYQLHAQNRIYRMLSISGPLVTYLAMPAIAFLSFTCPKSCLLHAINRVEYTAITHMPRYQLHAQTTSIACYRSPESSAICKAISHMPRHTHNHVPISRIPKLTSIACHQSCHT